MNPKLRDRRKDILRMHFIGIPITRIAVELAAKYGVSRRTIESDFTRRDSWMRDVLGDMDSESVINSLLVEMHQARQVGWQLLMGQHTTPNAKVAVLNVLFNSIFHEVELLQSVGRMPKAPDRLQQEIVGTQKIRLADITESEQACLNRAARILDEKMKDSYMGSEKDDADKFH